MDTIAELKRLLLAELVAAGIEQSESAAEVELIVRHATGMTLAEQIVNGDRRLDRECLRVVRSIVARRLRREPIQYCLGRAWFMGYEFAVRPGVFIPRSDSETLAQAALLRLNEMDEPFFVEIGCGSGALAISLLRLKPQARALAVDSSAEAVCQTRENALRLGVAERLQIVHADWAFALPPACDAIIANPPYIPRSAAPTLPAEVVEYEPHEALFGGGDDGLDFYRAIAARAGPVVNPAGFVAFEFGDGQQDAVLEIFARQGFASRQLVCDLNGLPRVIVAASQHLGL